MACATIDLEEPRQRGAYDAAAGGDYRPPSTIKNGTKATRGLRRRGPCSVEWKCQRKMWNQGNAGPTTPRPKRGALLVCPHARNQGNAGPTTPRRAGRVLVAPRAPAGTKATRGLRRRGDNCTTRPMVAATWEPRQRGAYDAAAARDSLCAHEAPGEPRQRGAYDAAARRQQGRVVRGGPRNQGNAGPTTPRRFDGLGTKTTIMVEPRQRGAYDAAASGVNRKPRAGRSAAPRQRGAAVALCG